jgi:hypothetical protein
MAKQKVKRPIAYMNETLIHTHSSASKYWH